MTSLLALCAALSASSEAAPDTSHRFYRQCQSCHDLAPGRNSAAGPTLYGIVGNGIAAEPNFNYSPALRAFAMRHRRWTIRLLDRFLENPERTVRGTEMGYPGMRDREARRTLIRWLALQRR